MSASALALAETEDAHGQAVAEAFRTHAGLVERVLRRAGVAERDLGDARQEVFIVVHRRLSEFEGRASLSTWLFRIALHVASDYRRRAYQRRERLSAGAGPTAEAGSPSASAAAEPLTAPAPRDPLASLEQRELLDHALRALEALDPDKREAFVLSELYELPMREVAARLGCPEKTAFSRTYAARRRILAELHKHGALPILPLFFHPFRALGPLRIDTGGANALAPASVLGPIGWVTALAVACALVVTWAREVPAEPASTRPGAARTVLAASSAPEPIIQAHAPSAPRVPAGSAAGPAAPAPAPKTTATRSPRPRSLAAPLPEPPVAPQPIQPAETAVPNDLMVVRTSAVDLRPQLQSPLDLGPSEPQDPRRIQLRGPSDPADGVERALR